MNRLLILPLLIGCGGAKSNEADTSTAQTEGDTASIGESDTGGADTGTTESIAWWQLAAEVVIAEGTPQPEASQLTLTLLTDALKPLCAETFTLASLDDQAVPHGDVYVWWQVVVGKGDGGCHASALPQADLLLGIGAMHPDILPGLKSSGAAKDPSALSGAYASLDDGESLLVFGAAGLSVAWAEGGEPATEAPLADGTWRIEPVYTFEYSP